MSLLGVMYGSGKEDCICMEGRLRDVHSSESDLCFPFSVLLRGKRGKNLKLLIDKTGYLMERISKQINVY